MFWLDTLFSSVIMISIAYIGLPIGLKTKSSKFTIIAVVYIVTCIAAWLGITCVCHMFLRPTVAVNIVSLYSVLLSRKLSHRFCNKCTANPATSACK